MTNPFENEDGRFLVLVNAEEQHSLWPAEIAVPDGWDVVHGPQDRTDCLRYVERSWTDMRPASIRK
ncbi:MbtH family protein [Streptomyces sp. MB22_4]|uniref:MbtH family protein n=1 Tax=Streptomyces sp. MB22_4 TaxID=3383120 RepID=UPI0039A3B389